MVKGVLDLSKVVEIKSTGFEMVDGELFFIQNCLVVDDLGNLKEVKNAINPSLLTKDFKEVEPVDYS